MRRLAWSCGVLTLTVAACSSPAEPPAASTPAPAAVAPATSAPPAAPPGADTTAATPAPRPEPAAPGVGAARPAPSGGRSTAPPPPVASSPTPAAGVSPAPVSPAPASAPAAPMPEYREVTVPAGTRLSIELRTALATDTSHVEDRVRGVLRQALAVDGAEVVPAGAPVVGSVLEADRAGKVKGRAHLALRFTSITIDDADVRLDSERIARDAEGTKRDDAAKIGIGAGAGAIVGAITGGKKGAAVGGAIGAGAGTGVVLATRGDEVRLDAGTVLTTTLREPLVVRQRVR